MSHYIDQGINRGRHMTAAWHRERAAYYAWRAERNAELAERHPHTIHGYAARVELMREMADTHIESAERAEAAS